MLDKRVLAIASLAAIALAVTVILYHYFNNYASFQSIRYNIKLGGSVAFFFILFTTEFYFMKSLYIDNLEPIRKALSGKWECITEIKKAENDIVKYRGTANIQQKEGRRITVIGKIDDHAESWEADEVVLTDSKLVYFFDVPLLHLSGVTSLRFSYDKKPLNEMMGFWILSGQEGRGSVLFKRLE